MTKEELYAKYAEQVKAKAAEFRNKMIEEGKMFMPREQLEETADNMYKIFLNGADAARDVLVDLITKYAKDITIKEMEKKI